MALHNFINMGGYGPFVWSCYGLTAAVLLWTGLSSRRQLQSELVSARRRAQIQSGTSTANPVTKEQ